MQGSYLDEQARDLPHALALCTQNKAARTGRSIGLTGNAATVLPELLKLGYKADIATGQTSAHDLIDHIPEGDIDQVLQLRQDRPPSSGGRL